MTDAELQEVARYVLNVLHSLPQPPSIVGEELRAARRLVVDKELVLSAEAITYLKRQLGLP